MSSLEKTGNFQEANEQVERMNKIKKKKYLLSKKPIQHSGGPQYYSQTIELDSKGETANHSFYITDDRGNLLKVSKDSIFEVTNDQYFKNPRMMPKLNDERGPLAGKAHSKGVAAGL